MSPAVAGLVMVNVFQTAVFVPFVMQLKANFIAFLNSLQRNFQYTSLAQEAAAVVPGRSPAPSWPERGAIRLEGVSFRYRPELPLVLRSVTVNIGEDFVQSRCCFDTPHTLLCCSRGREGWDRGEDRRGQVLADLDPAADDGARQRQTPH